MKHIHTFSSFLNEASESAIYEGISQEAYAIHSVTQCGQDAAQNFIDDNNIDAKKLVDYVRQYSNSKEKYDIRDLIAKPDSNKKLLSQFVKESVDEAYKQVPYNVKISGKYEITINSKVIKTSIAGFERENDDSDSLYLMDNDPLKAEHGSFIVKNSDMPKLEKGTVVKAMCSKHNTPATLKRIGDL